MKVNNLTELRNYLHGMFCGRPGDKYPRIQHSGLSESTVLALVGAVISVHDTGTININERKGRLANVCWFKKHGDWFALAYNRNGGVDLRDRSMRGRTIATFNDRNVGTVASVFATI